MTPTDPLRTGGPGCCLEPLKPPWTIGHRQGAIGTADAAEIAAWRTRQEAR